QGHGQGRGIATVRVPQRRGGRRTKGKGEVVYHTADQAARAAEALNGAVLHSRRLAVFLRYSSRGRTPQ
ncbi:unnamed protein product, partial [Ectocarpus sp. 8 AP-2014]